MSRFAVSPEESIHARVPPVDVRFTDISYEIPSSNPLASRLNPFSNSSNPPTQILKSISGYVPAGSSLAILGPSGSGKTTLLNLLAARSEHPPSSGRILFGGAPRVARTKRRIGYVMQDDVFFSKLTVLETLNFTADIRIANMSRAQRRERVQDILAALRLTHCQHTRIGDQQFDKGISGGERKRVNIANELLHDPSLMLADECTSGLDSASALTVIQLLSNLCNSGRTIIASIHQPSSRMFSMFDNIMLLSAGRMAYMGPPSRVISYFESIGFPFPSTSYNPADFLLELVIDAKTNTREEQTEEIDAENPAPIPPHQRIIDMCESRKSELLAIVEANALEEDTDHSQASNSSSDEIDQTSTKAPPARVIADPPGPDTQAGRMLRALKKRSYDIVGQHHKLNVPDKYARGWFQQLAVLSRRAIRQKRGMILQPIYLVQLTLVAIITAICWWQIETNEDTIEDRLGLLSFVPVYWSFSTMFTALYTFPTERQVLNKDRASGYYRLSAYFTAKNIMEIPADTLYPIVFSVIVYYSAGLNPDVRCFFLFLIILVLTVLTAQGVGLLISAAVMDFRKGQVMATLWVLLSMLISGYYINPDNTPSFITWVRSLSFIKYGYEALVQVEMLYGREFECGVEQSPFQIGSECPITREGVLQGSQINQSISIAGNIGILLTWIVLLRLAGFFCLKYLNTNHKTKTRIA